jgi:hypothetical protein
MQQHCRVTPSQRPSKEEQLQEIEDVPLRLFAVDINALSHFRCIMFSSEQGLNGDSKLSKEDCRYSYNIGSYGDTPRQQSTPPLSPAGLTGSLGALSQRSHRRRRGILGLPAVSSLPNAAADEPARASTGTAAFAVAPCNETAEAAGLLSVPLHLLQPSSSSALCLARWGSPLAPKERIVSGKWIDPNRISEFQARFTVLNEYAVRCECVPLNPPHNRFEDRPTMRFWRRDLGQEFEMSVRRRQDGLLLIRTKVFTLLYDPAKSHGAFENGALRIILNDIGPIAGLQSDFNLAGWITQPVGEVNPFEFVFGISDPSIGNCGGTCRTLDGANGWAYDKRSQREYHFGRYVDLGNGIISRRGWAIVDDSTSPIFDAHGWICERARDPRSVDLYVFAYGDQYSRALQTFTSIAGKVPLLPRYALGNWWSRWWPYSQSEIIQWVNEWKNGRNIPLSVCILDMDWHLPGWTGYTWNPELFPDPLEALRALKQLGVRIGLNVHPADGVHAHESMYTAMATALGVDASSGTPLYLNVASPSFMKAYFEFLHNPHERIGVDFWWIDWQQGTQSGVAGLDPLIYLNHLHCLDSAREFGRAEPRALILSRYGGLGNHRYPVGFSGDTHSTWESLAVQPVITATAANVGFFFWSHDIGGFMGGVQPDGELYVRWVQLGVYSPILRLHGHKSEFIRRWPWSYEKTYAVAATAALRYRHRLIPYIYSQCVKASLKSTPLCRPLYYQYPTQNPLVYTACCTQYFFGDELLVAPFLEPILPSVGCARRVLWLPPGTWRHLPSGEAYAGNRWICVYGGVDDVPVFAASGAIVPLASSPGCRSGIANDFAALMDDQNFDADAGLENPEMFDVTVVAGGEHTFQMIEDDGSGGDDPLRCARVTCFSTDFQVVDSNPGSRKAACETLTVQIWSDAVGPDAGQDPARSIWSPMRQFTIHFVGVVDLNALAQRGEAANIRVSVDDGHGYREIVEGYETSYDAFRETWTCALPKLGLDTRIRIEICGAALLSARDRRSEKLRDILQRFRLDCWSKICLARELHSFLEGMKSIHDILREDSTLTDYEYAGYLSEEQIRALYEIGFECGVEWLRTGYHPLWPHPAPVVAWNPRRSVAFVAPTSTSPEIRRGRYLSERRELQMINEVLAEAIMREQRALSQASDGGRLSRPPPVSSAESEGYSDSLPPRIPSRSSNIGLTTGSVPSAFAARLSGLQPGSPMQLGIPLSTGTSPGGSFTNKAAQLNMFAGIGGLDSERKPPAQSGIFPDPALAGFRVVRDQELVFPADPLDDWSLEYHYGPDLAVHIASNAARTTLAALGSSVSRHQAEAES